MEFRKDVLNELFNYMDSKEYTVRKREINNAFVEWTRQIRKEQEKEMYERFEEFEMPVKKAEELFYYMYKQYIDIYWKKPQVVIMSWEFHNKLTDYLIDVQLYDTSDTKMEKGILTKCKGAKVYVFQNLKYDCMMTDEKLSEHEKGLACKGEK